MSVFFTPEEAQVILCHSIRVWESTRSKKAPKSNQWTVYLSNLVITYIEFSYWDESSISRLYVSKSSNLINKEHIKLKGNDVIDVLGEVGEFNYGCVFGKDIISNDRNFHHWKIKIINVNIRRWSFIVGIFDINTLDFDKIDLKEAAKGYGISIEASYPFCLNFNEPDLADFKTNTFKLVENNKIIIDLIEGSDRRVNNEKIEINTKLKYKFGILSKVKNNQFRLLEYNNQTVKF